MSRFTNQVGAAPAQAGGYVAAILELLGERDPLEVLRGMPDQLRSAMEGVEDERLTRPEAPARWSLRDVAQHLADNDLVWGFRLRMVLAQERPPLAGYDQDQWARDLAYDRVRPEEALEAFAAMRRLNLALLARVPDAALDRVGIHAERGEESVRHMMRLYAGHDLVHLRQAERIRGVVG
jgi:uncharacterized damage-inducible protein DinB